MQINLKRKTKRSYPCDLSFLIDHCEGLFEKCNLTQNFNLFRSNFTGRINESSGGLAGGLLNAALESFAQQGKGREALNLLNVVEGPNVGAYAAAFLSCQQYEVLNLLKCDMMWRLSPNLIKKHVETETFEIQLRVFLVSV